MCFLRAFAFLGRSNMMPRHFLVLLCWLAISTSLPAHADAIDWDDLVDLSAQDFEDPFRDLDYDTLSQLRIVVSKRQQLANDSVELGVRETDQVRLAEAEEALKVANVDVDWLISQRWAVAERRERAARSGNPELNGRTVTLAGFYIPAPLSADGIHMAYLVPKFGMCSHVPPPPPNQLVRLRFPDGVDAHRLYESLRLTGELFIDPSATKIYLVDGMRAMEATWTLEVKNIERLQTAGAPFSRSRWPFMTKAKQP